MTKSRISRDEKDVKSVLSEVFIPPLSEQLLVSTSARTVVTESEADKIMKAVLMGKPFIDNRLSNNPKTSFYDSIKIIKTRGFTGK